MKVLVLSHMYPHPSEPTFGLFVHNQVKELARRCQVQVVSPTPLSPPVLRGLRARWTCYASKPSTAELEGIRINYPRYIHIPGVRGFPLSAFLCGWAIAPVVSRLKKAFDFDLIHAHTICPDGFAAVQIGRRVNTPVICTVHGSDINIYPHRTPLTRLVTQRAIKSVDVIVTVSAALKEKVLALASPRQEIRIVTNGVDLQRFAPIDKRQARAELNLPRDDEILLYASRLDEAKGLSYLLTAFKMVLSHADNCLLVLVGDGPYRTRLNQEIVELGLGNKVLLAGPRSHNEIPKWMSACDLVVQPSLNEGSPLPVYEALACGRPIVASCVGGIPELITSEDYGLLVPPANAEALAQALLNGLRKEWNVQRIRGHGEKYAWGRIADELIGLYEDILASQVEKRIAYAGLYQQA